MVSEEGVMQLTIDIAEARGFAFLGVMKTTSPVYRNVALLAVQSGSTFHASASADTTKLKQPVENRAIVSDVVFALFFLEGVHVIGGNLLQEVDVFVRMKLRHFTSSCGFRTLFMAR